MAHIVARSGEGPRGADTLSVSELDAYDNLILLCPNHHREVDSDLQSWPVFRLHQQKGEHETWIQTQLEQGRLSSVTLAGESFRSERVAHWARHDFGWALIVTLTPLAIQPDAFNPVSHGAKSILQEMRFPDGLSRVLGSHPSPNYIEPSEHGLVAEDFTRIEEGFGYRCEIFRSGHVELVLSLEFARHQGDLLLASRIGRMAETTHRFSRCTQLLRYSDMAELVVFQTSEVYRLWQTLELPFNDMIFGASLVVASGTCLIHFDNFSLSLGRPLEGAIVEYSLVVGSEEARLIEEESLRRLVSSFGFVVNALRDTQGDLIPPLHL